MTSLNDLTKELMEEPVYACVECGKAYKGGCVLVCDCSAATDYYEVWRERMAKQKLLNELREQSRQGMLDGRGR